MPPVLWLPILTKAVATALVVVFASALAETMGPFWGALVASLPVSAGPVYVFLAMQHDRDFVAACALNSFAANAATGAFLIVYAMFAARFLLRWSLGAAVASWFAASWFIRQIAWTPGTAVLLNLTVFGMGFWLLRDVQEKAPGVHNVAIRLWFDLPLRAVAVALFVVGVVVASSVLGPAGTGIAVVFPVSLTSLIVILRPRIGGAASALLAATALRAMSGFGFALLVLHLVISPWGPVPALLVALLVSMLWSGGLLVLRGGSRIG